MRPHSFGDVLILSGRRYDAGPIVMGGVPNGVMRDKYVGNHAEHDFEK